MKRRAGIEGAFPRMLAWLVLLLGAVFFLTTGGTYPGIASVDAHLIGQVLAYVILGGWLALVIVRPSWRPRTPLLIPLALACLAYGASLLFSQRPRLSFEPAVAGLGWAYALLFLSRLLADGWFRARTMVVMTAFVAIVAIGYLVQVGIEWVSWWGLVGRFTIPPLRPSFAALFFGSPNLIATALTLLAPLVVVLMWNRGRGRPIAAALAVASLLAIFVSGSRGAWLGAGVGVLVGLTLAATRGSARDSLRRLVASVRTRPVLLAPLAIALIVGLALTPSIVARFAQGGGTLRLDLWRAALSIFAEHPLFGAGPGTWVQLKVETNPAGVANLILPHAHDVYVQAAAEIGFVGLLALAYLAFAVARRLWAGWRSPISAEAGAVIVSLAALAGQSLVDSFVNLPFAILIIIALIAWVDGGLTRMAAEGQVERRSAPRWRARLADSRVIPALGLVALVLLFPTLVRIDRAAVLAVGGDTAAQRGHWQVALDAFDGARTLDPDFTLYEIQTASALARVGRAAEARDLLGHVLESDRVAINLIGLASLEANLGERDGALAHARDAAALGLGEPTIALNAGLIGERLGDQAFAVAQFANAVAWDPPLASSGIWVSPPRVATREEIVDQAVARVDELDGQLIRAYAGQALAARAALELMEPSSRREVYVAASEWLGGDPAAALARIDRLLEHDPGDWFAAAWGARIARLSRDTVAENRYSAWALAVQADAASSVIAQLSSVPAFSTDTTSLPGNYPWAVYLRPASVAIMAPSLVLIGGE